MMRMNFDSDYDMTLRRKRRRRKVKLWWCMLSLKTNNLGHMTLRSVTMMLMIMLILLLMPMLMLRKMIIWWKQQVYRLMGYDSEKREIKMGMLAEKTHPYIRDKVIIKNTNTHIQIQKHPNTNIIKWWKRIT